MSKPRAKPSKRGRGRPELLTPEVTARIVSALKQGVYMETAAVYAGIARPTFFLWLKKGHAEPSSIYGAFVGAVDEALARAEVRDVAIISAASSQQWQAAAWKLERRYPERWARRDPDKMALAELERRCREVELKMNTVITVNVPSFEKT